MQTIGSFMTNRGFTSPYHSSLDIRQTERAIKFIKDYFQTRLAKVLNLSRISAPILVSSKSGINDYLNGVERPVRFHVKDMNEEAEVVQSLAKWKRAALASYGFKPGEGLYTDMNAIRPDEKLDNLHSAYVDQWDWELVIREGDRNLEFLKGVVRKIYKIIRKAEKVVCRKYKLPIKLNLPKDIYFVHSEELEEMYPALTPTERENEICREKGAVFIIGIGYNLKNGAPHDGRAADYDDWSTETVHGRHGLNGDILVWYPVLECAFELSSMGIRVDKRALLKQFEIKSENARLPYHHRLLAGELPITIGGGIGQSRLCMLYLRKAHIGEVQAGIWPEEMVRECRKGDIHLL